MPLLRTESCGFMIVNDHSRHSGIAARDDRVSMLRLRGKAKLRSRSQVLVDEIESAILADRGGCSARIVLTVAARGNGERADSLFGYGD